MHVEAVEEVGDQGWADFKRVGRAVGVPVRERGGMGPEGDDGWPEAV